MTPVTMHSTCRSPFHLQSVWAIISEPRDVEVLVEVRVELCALHQRAGSVLRNQHFSRSRPLRLPRLMIRKLWLVFCQTATVCVAALFVVTTLRPDLFCVEPARERRDDS